VRAAPAAHFGGGHIQLNRTAPLPCAGLAAIMPIAACCYAALRSASTPAVPAPAAILAARRPATTWLRLSLASSTLCLPPTEGGLPPRPYLVPCRMHASRGFYAQRQTSNTTYHAEGYKSTQHLHPLPSKIYATTALGCALLTATTLLQRTILLCTYVCHPRRRAAGLLQLRPAILPLSASPSPVWVLCHLTCGVGLLPLYGTGLASHCHAPTHDRRHSSIPPRSIQTLAACSRCGAFPGKSRRARHRRGKTPANAFSCAKTFRRWRGALFAHYAHFWLAT